MGVNNILQISRILLHEKPIILFLKKNILISVCMIKNVVGLTSFHSSKVKIITKADSSYRKQVFTNFNFFTKKPPQIAPGWLRWFGFQKDTYFFIAPKRTLKAAPTTPGFCPVPEIS